MAAAEAKMPERYWVQRQPRLLVTMNPPMNDENIGPMKTEIVNAVTYAFSINFLKLQK
jgi:hypothetical protein